MEREKVLGLLHLDFNGDHTSPLKGIFALDVVFSALMILCGAILNGIAFLSRHWLMILLFSVSCIAFAFMLRLAQNPVKRKIVCPFVVCATCCAKLFCGYCVFAEYEFIRQGIPSFSWVHTALLFFALIGALYFVVAFAKTYRMLKRYSYEETVTRMRKQRKRKSVVRQNLFVFVGGMLILVLIQALSNNIEKGYGICFWGLGCCWLLVSLALLPRVLIVIKYKPSRWIEK